MVSTKLKAYARFVRGVGIWDATAEALRRVACAAGGPRGLRHRTIRVKGMAEPLVLRDVSNDWGALDQVFFRRRYQSPSLAYLIRGDCVFCYSHALLAP